MIFANNSMLIRSRNQSPPDNEIWYFAPEKVTLYSETGVTSHTFSGGKGVITYSSAVTTVPTTLRGVTTVTDVQFPSIVTSIAAEAFSECTSLALKKLPDGLTVIRDFAFDGCKNLALTELPSGITDVYNYAFRGCSRMTLSELPTSLTIIRPYTFLFCHGLTLTSLPAGVTSISRGAFQLCSKLALTALPEGLTSIEAYSFSVCPSLALTSLPAGVTSIGESAFESCTGLTSITFLGTPTTLDATAFKGCTNLKDIYVPWAEGDIADAPWGATNATVHYTEPGGGAISFPESFSVTDCSGNGAAVGAYTKTAETTTVNGTNYPVYSMTQELLGTTFYIYVCGYQMGSAGVFWALKADSYSASDDSYGALGSCAAGTDGLPQSTSWSSASSDATVSW